MKEPDGLQVELSQTLLIVLGDLQANIGNDTLEVFLIGSDGLNSLLQINEFRLLRDRERKPDCAGKGQVGDGGT